MNKYYLTVYIGDYHECDGKLMIEANCLNDAIQKGIEEFGKRWVKAFPELDVTYDIEEDSACIDLDYITKQIQKAKRFCPSDEDIEITYDSDDDGFYIRKYNQKRGSAEPMDGFEHPIYYGYDIDLDKEFDEENIMKMVDYYTGR